MKQKTYAFTLAEALIILLIVSLLAAAIVPVITRKHRDVAAHGKWFCTLNNSGQHVIKTIFNGKDSGFTTAGSSCTFTPPANAKNFVIKAVGGGGGGAGGTSGKVESIFDSRRDGTSFAGSIKQTGSYTVTYAGGGGGGGGMSCGEAKNYIPPDLSNEGYFDQSTLSSMQRHNDWSWDRDKQTHDPNRDPCKNKACEKKSATTNKTYTFGYVDRPVTSFAYKMLTKNDKDFTDTEDTKRYSLTNSEGKFDGTQATAYDFKYHYLGTDQSTLQDKALCFAESNWPMSKEVNREKGLYLKDKSGSREVVKCWNLPGMGGRSGTSTNASVYMIAGQSIYARVGAGGKGKSLADSKTKGLYILNSSGDLVLKNQAFDNGAEGENGEKTVIDYGQGSKVASGGTGGAYRQLFKLTYVNVPVMECAIKETTGHYNNNPVGGCSGRTESSCNSTRGCRANTTRDWKSCGGGGICSDKHSYSSCVGGYYYDDVVTDKDGNKTTQQKYQRCYDVWGPYYFDYCDDPGHSGKAYAIDTANCTQTYRPTYFANANVYTCQYSSVQTPAKGDRQFLIADYPQFNTPISQYKPVNDDDGTDFDIPAMTGKTKYYGTPGSGGYGVGEETKNYIRYDVNSNQSYASLDGDEGAEGFVSITRTTAYGGTGGMAGNYISTMVRKLGKLQVTIGRPGAPSGGNSHFGGNSGGATIIKEKGNVLFELSGGLPGQADKLDVVQGGSVVPGGDGAPSPMENESNRAKVIPYGGKSGNNTSMNGLSAAIHNTWTNPLASAFGLSSLVFSLNMTGGHPLDMTYGAGGGGGAGSQSSAGNGGAGAPGAVIIEW